MGEGGDLNGHQVLVKGGGPGMPRGGIESGMRVGFEWTGSEGIFLLAAPYR